MKLCVRAHGSKARRPSRQTTITAVVYKIDSKARDVFHWRAYPPAPRAKKLQSPLPLQETQGEQF